MSLTAGERFGPYDVVGPLGAGGMGVVYRARDPRLGRDVAIKTLPDAAAADPSRLARFELEARAAGALSHPNVLVVHDVGRENGTAYLVTELLEGQTLRERLHAGPLPARKAVEYAMQVASGLAAVHEKGVVHRDLKPDNLFVTDDERVKILDFGVARALGADGPAASGTLPQTASGAAVGTAGYMAPEQVRGQSADERADVFALGAVLYECLTGRMAFPGATPVERGYAILNAEPADPSGFGVVVPGPLVRVVRRCLEKLPEQRFQRARDVLFALEAVGDATGSGAALPSPAPAPRAPPRWPFVLAALALLAVGAALGSLGEGPPPPPLVTPSAPPAPRRVSFRNGSIGTARFASGGRGLVYAGRFEGEAMQVFAGVVDGPQTRPVSAERTVLFDVSADDELALGTLRHEPGGPPGAVLSRAALAGGAARPVLEGVVGADFSPDGGLLVTRKTDRAYAVEYPVGRELVSTPEQLTSARLSPSGELVAWVRHPVPFDDRGRVEVVDLEGRLVARSPDAWTVDGVAWPPHGREVWFTAGDRNSQREVRALTLDGGTRSLYAGTGVMLLQDIDARGGALVSVGLNRHRIFGRLAGMDREQPLGWFDGSDAVDVSADGRALLFIEGLGAGGTEIETYLRTFDGTPPLRVGMGWGRALSPDRQWVALSPKAPFTTVSLVPTGPGTARELPPGDFSAITAVRFFPDGRRLVVSAKGPDQRPRVYVQTLADASRGGGEPRPADGAPRPVSDESLMLVAPPSPDGKRLAALHEGKHPVLVDVETGALERLPGAEPADVPLQWSADGRALFLAHHRLPNDPLRLDVFRYELATGKRTKLMELGPSDGVGMQGLRGALVTPDAKHYAYQVGQHLDELYVIDGLR